RTKAEVKLQPTIYLYSVATDPGWRWGVRHTTSKPLAVRRLGRTADAVPHRSAQFWQNSGGGRDSPKGGRLGWARRPAARCACVAPTSRQRALPPGELECRGGAACGTGHP